MVRLCSLLRQLQTQRDLGAERSAWLEADGPERLVESSGRPGGAHRPLITLAARRLLAATAALTALGPGLVCAQETRGRCMATSMSMTPGGRATPTYAARQPSPNPVPLLTLIADVPLPGPAKRFDYQSFDSTTGRLYISHMDANRLDVFDARAGKLLASEEGYPGATGVRAVPELHRVYVSVTGNHEVAVVDDRTLAVVARVRGVRFPDGIAYAPDEHKVFVSDESGEADIVIDARSNAKTGRIALGGEAGNTHYDAASHCIVVAVQTRNELVAIDPASERVVARYVMGCEHPHGFLIDELNRLAFVTCEDDAKLLLVDLRTMQTIETLRTADEPDVLALDSGLRRLYVGCESGAVTVFEERVGHGGPTLVPLGEYRAPHAHTVAVDPATHRVYLPLQGVHGKPVLRILAARR
jgi:DNA-binding beta-propeller fold protein YncE